MTKNKAKFTSLKTSLFFPTSKKRIGFSSVHFAAGLVLAVIFQLVQSVEGELYPLLNDRSFISQHYPTHQLEATVNFSLRINGPVGTSAA